MGSGWGALPGLPQGDRRTPGDRSRSLRSCKGCRRPRAAPCAGPSRELMQSGSVTGQKFLRPMSGVRDSPRKRRSIDRDSRGTRSARPAPCGAAPATRGGEQRTRRRCRARPLPPSSASPAHSRGPLFSAGPPKSAPAGPRRPRPAPRRGARCFTRPAPRVPVPGSLRAGGRALEAPRGDGHLAGRPETSEVLRGGGGRADRCLLHFALQCQRLQQRGLLTARPARAPGPAPPGLAALPR